MGKKLAVLVPGRNYSVDCPLLYYANVVFESRGYERKAVRFSSAANEKNITLDQLLLRLQPELEMELGGITFQEYEEVVFVSKSVGTALSGWYAQKYQIPARHIFMTPVPQTLPYLKACGHESMLRKLTGKTSSDCLVLAGLDDRYLGAMLLREACKRNGVHCIQFENAGHSMEVTGDWQASIKLLQEIMQLCEQF